MPASEVFVGIDVSKAHLDIALSDSDVTLRVANTEAGIEDLVARLTERDPALVVMGATGGFEIPAAAALSAAGIAVVIANPRQVRDFAPVIRVFYDRLRDKGKPPKVAQVACTRKLLTILNAMLRDGRKWDPSIPLEQLRLQHSC